VKVVVIGGSGVLGPRIVEALEASGHQPAVTLRNGEVSLDLAVDDPRERLARLEPDAVVLSAALTDVEACEADPDLAWRVNSSGPGRVAAWCAAAGVPMLHVSTDAVFGGGHGGWTERDEVDPLNAYARSKFLGERAVLASGQTVVRTNFIGAGKRGLLRWLHDELSEGRTVTGFRDAWFAPLSAVAVAVTLVRVLECGALGLFHVGGLDRISKYDLACCVRDLLGRGRVVPGLLAGRAGVPRPLDTSLDSTAVRSWVAVPEEHWRIGVEQAVRAMQDGS